MLKPPNKTTLAHITFTWIFNQLATSLNLKCKFRTANDYQSKSMVPQAILHEIPNNSTIYKYTFVSSAYSKERHRRCENYMLLALNQSTLQDQYSKILTLFSFMILLYGCCLCGAIEHAFIYVHIYHWYNFGLVWFDFIPFVSFSCVLQLIFFFSFCFGQCTFRNALNFMCARLYILIFVKRTDKRKHAKTNFRPK